MNARTTTTEIFGIPPLWQALFLHESLSLHRYAKYGGGSRLDLTPFHPSILSSRSSHDNLQDQKGLY
ncbi:hypothetical protein I308_105347 [Cryptococcus tetragattii IND107]|uniref:Uncharacterized protein n=1 Tax=Cryptococcus tetragattii IND107 TaxID=1296105 RepID=A0ABR3BN99_9TREE